MEHGNGEGKRMTLEQAIEVLISRYNSGVIRSRTNDDEWRLATETVIAALRGSQPDPATGLMACDYCNGTEKPFFHENNYEPHESMQSWIIISESKESKRHLIEVDLWDGANTYAAFEINYCPMCGRKLEVEG